MGILTRSLLAVKQMGGETTEASYQQMGSAERLKMTIDGKRVCELDIKATISRSSMLRKVSLST
jgi:hypothetical protein